LDRLSEKKFDILITDLKMKPPDGLELLHFTRNTYPETRVIIITGFATIETARDALKGGAVDFIAKPFHMSQLRDLVLKIAAEIQQGQP
jgi:DNA-binding NtrC family response regulator